MTLLVAAIVVAYRTFWLATLPFITLFCGRPRTHFYCVALRAPSVSQTLSNAKTYSEFQVLNCFAAQHPRRLLFPFQNRAFPEPQSLQQSDRPTAGLRPYFQRRSPFGRLLACVLRATDAALRFSFSVVLGAGSIQKYYSWRNLADQHYLPFHKSLHLLTKCEMEVFFQTLRTENPCSFGKPCQRMRVHASLCMS